MFMQESQALITYVTHHAVQAGLAVFFIATAASRLMTDFSLLLEVAVAAFQLSLLDTSFLHYPWGK